MNNINDCHIFGQGDKINDVTDKNGTEIHIESQLDPWNLFQPSSDTECSDWSVRIL